MMFAIIKTGGKQYKVAEGDVLMVEKLHANNLNLDKSLLNANEPMRIGDEVIFNEVLLVANGEVKIGKPKVAGAKVVAKIIEDGKGKKKIVFRYKSKTRQHKKKGHRQPFTKVQIVKIEG